MWGLLWLLLCRLSGRRKKRVFVAVNSIKLLRLGEYETHLNKHLSVWSEQTYSTKRSASTSGLNFYFVLLFTLKLAFFFPQNWAASQKKPSSLSKSWNCKWVFECVQGKQSFPKTMTQVGSLGVELCASGSQTTFSRRFTFSMTPAELNTHRSCCHSAVCVLIVVI